MDQPTLFELTDGEEESGVKKFDQVRANLPEVSEVEDEPPAGYCWCETCAGCREGTHHCGVRSRGCRFFEK